MFEETIILSRPVERVEWAEEDFPLIDDLQEPAAEKHQAESMRSDDELVQQAEQLALEQAQTMQLEEIRDLFELINQSIEKHFGMMSRRMRTVENNVIALALAVAKKIIDKEIDVNPSVVRASIEKALQRMNEETDVVIQVNPDDKEIVEKHWQEIAPQHNMSGWKLEAKSGIGRGGCIIRSANEIIDATIESQMQLVEQVIADSMTSSLTPSEGIEQI